MFGKIVLGILCLLMLNACDDDNDNRNQANAKIGAAGGTLTGPDGVQVIIPPGALTQETTIGIARSSAGAPQPLPSSGSARTGKVYEFTPHGLEFNQPVTLRMPIPTANGQATIYMAETDLAWHPVSATVTNGIAEWQRLGFSWVTDVACAIQDPEPDPFPCSQATMFGTTMSSTPVGAITEAITIPGAEEFLFVVSHTATLHLTWKILAPHDCGIGHLKITRKQSGNPITLLETALPLVESSDTSLSAEISQDVFYSHLDNGSSGIRTEFSCTRQFNGIVRTAAAMHHFKIAIPVPTTNFSVGGTITGLQSGKSIILQNNGGDDLTINADGNFTFATQVGNDTPFNVTIVKQPVGQTCSLSNSSGVATGPINNVQVACTTLPISIGGTVSGLTGSGLVLQNNGTDDLSVSVDGSFTFPSNVANGGIYVVSVLTNPTGQTCSVSSGNGVANTNVTDVLVSCVATSSGGPFTIGGTVVGYTGEALRLQLNNTPHLQIDNPGNFTFANTLPGGTAFSVVVTNQPIAPSQTCSVTNGTGTVNANVTNIVVTCVP